MTSKQNTNLEPGTIVTMPTLDELTTNEKGETMQNPNTQEKPVTEKLDELHEQASIATRELSAAYSTDSVSKINAARVKVKTIVDKYNAMTLDALYASYLSADSPIFQAAKDGYCRILRLNERQTKDGTLVSIEHATRVIDLRELEKKAGGRVITHKARWAAYAEKLALLFAARATSDIGGDVSELMQTFKMTELARGMSLGGIKSVNPRAKDPISNRSLIDAMQETMDAVLFVPVEDKEHNKLHITSNDVAYALYTMFRKGKKELSVSMPRLSTIVTVMTEIAYKLINEKVYSADYEKIETKVKAA